MSWLRPSNRSASVSLPSGPSKTYSLSTLTQGSSRRSALSWSRSRVSSFSLAQKLLARREPLLLRHDLVLHCSTPFT